MPTAAPIARPRPLRWRVTLWGVVALLLVLPLAAMWVTREVDWSAGDFAAAAVLLGGAAGLVELAVATLGSRAARLAAVAAVLALLVLVWLQLAVGLIR